MTKNVSHVAGWSKYGRVRPWKLKGDSILGWRMFLNLTLAASAVETMLQTPLPPKSVPNDAETTLISSAK